jgi:hypothetical protein
MESSFIDFDPLFSLASQNLVSGDILFPNILGGPPGPPIGGQWGAPHQGGYPEQVHSDPYNSQHGIEKTNEFVSEILAPTSALARMGPDSKLLFSFFPLSPGLNLLDGFFHGFVFSSPFSVPIIISIYRFILEGPVSGVCSTLGTILGQLTFFAFLRAGTLNFLIPEGTGEHTGNFFPLVSIWYTFEPILALLGFLLSFKIAADLWTGQAGTINSMGSLNRTNNSKENLIKRFSDGLFSSVVIQSFGFNFLLMFLNPSVSANASRIILSAPNLLGLEKVGENFLISENMTQSPFVLTPLDSTNYTSYSLFNYNIGFFISAFLLISFIWPILFTILLKILKLNHFFFVEKKPFFSTTNLGSFAEVSVTGKNQINRGFFSFLIIGCLLSSFLQYSWRLFIQYPLELVNGGSLTNTKISENNESIKKFSENRAPQLNYNSNTTESSNISLSSLENEAKESTKANLPLPVREFPSFDSNIRHRDKNLPVDRHLPIEKMNTRRTLSGRPSLNEEQKSDAFFRFNSFFINNLEGKVENKLVGFRNSSSNSEISSIAEYLEKVKRVLSKQDFGQTEDQYSLKPKLESTISRSARPLENNTKGKPPKGFSFISENIDSKAFPSDPNYSTKTKNPYLHDELQIYGVLFHQLT